MKIIVTGDREWTSERTIERALRVLPPGSIVVHGACRGADRIADRVARRLGLDVRPYPAEWQRIGRGAGPARNRQMYRLEQPDAVWAFHDDIAVSKGTADMLLVAHTGGTPTYLYESL